MKNISIGARSGGLVEPLRSSFRRSLTPLKFFPMMRRSMNRLLPFNSKEPSAIAPAESAEALAEEVAALQARQLMVECEDFMVFSARAFQIPTIMREIGRLREIAFRKAGEGTGRASDLDRFDSYYTHLFLWNCQTREIAGAYRLARTEIITRQFGTRGLYTHTLFDYGMDLINELGPAIELGRSFIRVEYQRKIAPLFVLWKGIGRIVAQHPECKRLFGPVSISNSYGPASRSLMIEFLRAHYYDAGLAARVRPRSPVRIVGSAACQNVARISRVEELSAVVAELEGESTAVPVLLKQYLKLGGRLIGFNLDREFSDVIDGLIVVDLTQTDRHILERYLGEDGAKKLLKFHSDSRPAVCA